MAQSHASQAGLRFDAITTQVELIQLLSRHLDPDAGIRNLFHALRVEGSRATHGFVTQHREAMDGLRVARELFIWFHRALGKAAADFLPGQPQDRRRRTIQLPVGPAERQAGPDRRYGNGCRPGQSQHPLLAPAQRLFGGFLRRTRQPLAGGNLGSDGKDASATPESAPVTTP